MELKEYFKIFKNDYKAFFITVSLVLILGATLYYLVIKDGYKSEIDLNVTRTGYQKDTADYRYDEFYRLQADERFADTVVRWLGSKVIISEIVKEANGAKFRNLKAERLSSQMIRVSFIISSKNDAEKITKAIEKVLDNKVSELNLEQKNPHWFKVLVSYPVVGKQGIDIIILLGMLIFGGVFVGFWVVLIRYYLK